MSGSNEQTPRIYRVGYEPTALPATSVMACPHCGGSVEVPAPAAEAGQRAEPVRVESTAGLPEAGPVRRPVGRVLTLLLEVIDGRRPADQLTAVATPTVLQYARSARPRGLPARVSRLQSLRVCRPTEHMAEAAAVVALGERVRAVAARFEHGPSGWRCVALRIL